MTLRNAFAAMIFAVFCGLSAPSPAADSETVRAEIGRPLQAAQDLLKAKKPREALEKIHEADAIADKTAYESYVLERLRLVAAVDVSDGPMGAKAYEALSAQGRLTDQERPKLQSAIAAAFYQSKDYGSAVTWWSRAKTLGDSDGHLGRLIAQSYYLAQDYANAAKVLRDDIAASATPTEEQLQFLLTVQGKIKDMAGYSATLDRLLAAYPKPEYWDDVLQRVPGRPGFADRLQLDLGRLRQAAVGLKTAGQLVEQVELALQAGFPAEAKVVLDGGYAAGTLGTGPDAERHKRLKDLADHKTVEDQAQLASAQKDALAAKDGNGLVVLGVDYLGYGQAAKAAELIQQGIAKGGLKFPGDAQLHLGIALMKAGQTAKAVEAFKAVKATDGAGDLARLWMVLASR